MASGRFWPAALTALIAAAPAAARAQPVTATYTVYAAGVTVMEVQTVLDLRESGYELEFQSRLVGVATAFGQGRGTTRVSGTWDPTGARPVRYRSDGVWRGESRRTLIEYPGGLPTIREMVPPNQAEREEVPEAARRGTLDSLSALAALIRQVQRTGRCESTARVYDGRRLTEMSARTEAQEILSGGRGEWSGRATRCRFEGRLVAGFHRENNGEEARRPQVGTAWMGEARPGGPVLPVRIEVPTRWFGTLTARLTEVGPVRPAAAR